MDASWQVRRVFATRCVRPALAAAFRQLLERRVPVAPRRPLTVRFAVPALEVDRAGLLHGGALVVVDPVARERARADELVLGRAVGSDRQREGRPRRRAADAEERLAAHAAR